MFGCVLRDPFPRSWPMSPGRLLPTLVLSLLLVLVASAAWSAATGIRQAFDQAHTWSEFVSLLPSTYRWLFHRSTWIGVFGLAFAFRFLRSIEPLRYEPGVPPRLSVAGKRFSLPHVSGTVRDIQRWTKFSVHRTHTTSGNLDGSTHTETNSHLVGRDHLQIILATPA